MTTTKGKTHSSELLRIEANRSKTPACLHLNNNNNSTKKLSTYRQPPSSVLERARSFLPQLAKANDELQNKMAIFPASKFDIENLDDCPGSHIEMDVAIVERDDSSESSDEDNSAQDDDDDENSDDDGDSVLCSSALSKTEPALFNKLHVDSLKLPGAKPVLKKNSIQVLDDNSTENENKDESRVAFHNESTR